MSVVCNNEISDLTIISTDVHRDVPQYIAIPWLITWVIALTVSDKMPKAAVRRSRLLVDNVLHKRK